MATALLSKKQAAEFLGIGLRTLVNYAKQGKLSVTYRKGKYGQEAYYKQAELEPLRKEWGHETVKGALIPKPESELIPTNPQQFALAPSSPRHRPLMVTEIAAKPLLGLDEAAVLRGLSKQILREAIRSETLKAKRIGNAFRFRHADLDRYIEALF